jgi:hypothetical protein
MQVSYINVVESGIFRLAVRLIVLDATERKYKQKLMEKPVERHLLERRRIKWDDNIERDAREALEFFQNNRFIQLMQIRNRWRAFLLDM